jgi:hypothetical protein
LNYQLNIAETLRRSRHFDAAAIAFDQAQARLKKPLA